MHYLIDVMGLSERFAGRVTGQHRTTQRHHPAGSTPADPDAGLRSWLRDYAKTHPRWGHRRAYHDARGEGWTVNHKKVQRLWREEGLRVPQRRRRKRCGASTAETPTADAPNRVWAVDFQFDSTTDGRPVKIVSIVDEQTRECLGGLVERSITSDRLIDELDGSPPIAAIRPCCAATTAPNSPAKRWPTGPGTGRVRLHPTRPALANGYIGSFNGRLRDECFNLHLFCPYPRHLRHHEAKRSEATARPPRAFGLSVGALARVAR